MTRTLTAFLLALIVAIFARAEPPAAQPNTPVPPAPPATATTADAKASPPGPAPYVRATDVDGGKHVLLQTAARTFRSADPGTPEIHLVGAVHIGEKKFYQELQTFLDQHDVVLFEGVKPPGAGAHDPALSPEATDDQRAELSKKRIHLTAMLIEVYKRDNNGQLPATLADLTTMSDKRVAYLATVVGKDAWGRPLAYSPDAGGGGAGAYSLSSLAADGAAGGEGPNADIAYADLPQVTPEELPGGAKGIQSQLAEAFGLVFQLDEMDHTKPNWQNSDMSIDQVQARIEAAGADGSALFSMLDGSSLQARLAGLLFRIIAASPTFQTVGKVVLIDTLDKAEEMMGAMPGGMGKLMSVIIVDRNQVVIDDLKALLASRPDLKSIAIIYGAGHLADLEQRLGAMGYKPVEDRWFTAIDVDVTAGGAMTVGQVNSFRTMMARTMTRAIEESKRDGERAQLRAQRRQQREEQKQPEPAAEPK